MEPLRLQATRLLNLCLTILLLAGCSDSGTEAAFERYLNRLARPLGGQVQPPGRMPQWPATPRTGALRIALAPSKLGTLDFLSLSGCAVQITIGKRNSSLGKMASDSQRLLLDLEYLQLAPECIAAMRKRGSKTLATILADALQLKIQQLPARIFNATLANREYHLFWQRPTSPGDYPQQTSSSVPTALAAINQTIARWLSGDYQFDNQGFETLLAEVASGDGGALAGAAGGPFTLDRNRREHRYRCGGCTRVQLPSLSHAAERHELRRPPATGELRELHRSRARAHERPVRLAHRVRVHRFLLGGRAVRWRAGRHGAPATAGGGGRHAVERTDRAPRRR